MDKQEKGKTGETIAAEYLQAKGYRILAQNWHYRHYEVDIIASDEHFIVFVEVKTRKTDLYGQPEEFVTWQKQKNIIEAARYYVNKYRCIKEVRFDIISIILDQGPASVYHIPDAYGPRW